MSIEYVAPSFLQNKDPETIYDNMKSTAPTDIDTSEGSFFYDATYPVAIEKAEMIQFQLNEVIKLIFPQWAYDIYLDLHAAAMGTKRKDVVAATTDSLVVTGVDGTVIPKGYQFSTPSTDTTSSIVFATKAAATISGGSATVGVECQTAGKIGNVPANTITLMFDKPIDGVLSVTNTNETTGGTDIESDEALQERLDKIRKSLGGAGSKSDYEKWGLEVAGIGVAKCIPEWMGPGTGTVKLICLDANGEPASPALIEAVQNYIAPLDGSGKAPVGAIFTAVAPTMRNINYVATITPKTGYTESQCIVNVKTALEKLYLEIGVNGFLKYSQAFTAFANAEGVGDVSDLTMNGGTANIQLDIDEFARTGTVNGV